MNTKLLTAPIALSLSLLAVNAHADTTQVPRQPVATEGVPALTGERIISIKRADSQSAPQVMPSDTQMMPADQTTQMTDAQMDLAEPNEAPSTSDEMTDTTMQDAPAEQMH